MNRLEEDKVAVHIIGSRITICTITLFRYRETIRTSRSNNIGLFEVDAQHVAKPHNQIQHDEAMVEDVPQWTMERVLSKGQSSPMAGTE